MLNKKAGINLSTETIIVLILVVLALVILVLILTGVFKDITYAIGGYIKNLLGVADTSGINA